DQPLRTRDSGSNDAGLSDDAAARPDGHGGRHQFGDAALLGGLAAGALIFDVVFTTFNFLRSGTTGLVAQAFGRGDTLEEQAVFWRAVLIALAAGILLAALSPAISLAGQWFI